MRRQPPASARVPLRAFSGPASHLSLRPPRATARKGRSSRTGDRPRLRNLGKGAPALSLRAFRHQVSRGWFAEEPDGRRHASSRAPHHRGKDKRTHAQVGELGHNAHVVGTLCLVFVGAVGRRTVTDITQAHAFGANQHLGRSAPREELERATPAVKLEAVVADREVWDAGRYSRAQSWAMTNRPGLAPQPERRRAWSPRRAAHPPSGA